MPEVPATVPVQTVFIPPVAKSLKDSQQGKIILGLQGDPGTGKSTAAASFPNAIFWSLEPIPGIAERYPNIPCIPFYDFDFIQGLDNGTYKREAITRFPNVSKAFRDLMFKYGPQLKKGQTLIVDSWTALQDAFLHTWKHDRKFTDKGKEDNYHFWKMKLDYSGEVMKFLVSLPCHLIVVFHETRDRDPETGQLLDKVKPLMSGQYAAEIKRNFPDFFRSRIVKDKDGNFKYVWQVVSDGEFDAKCTLTKLPKKEDMINKVYIEASYENYVRYR